MKRLTIGCLVLVSFALTAAPPKSTPELLKKGEAAYKANCVSCHGNTGAGDGDLGKMLKPPPRNLIKDKFKKGLKPQDVFNTISKGIPSTGMAGYGHLSEDDRWGLAYFVLEMRAKKK